MLAVRWAVAGQRRANRVSSVRLSLRAMAEPVTTKQREKKMTSVPQVQCKFCDEKILLGISDPSQLPEPFERTCSKYPKIGTYWHREIEGWTRD